AVPPPCVAPCGYPASSRSTCAPATATSPSPTIRRGSRSRRCSQRCGPRAKGRPRRSEQRLRRRRPPRPSCSARGGALSRRLVTQRIEDFAPLRRRRRLRNLKDVPVLPSLVTLGNVFFGFLAIAKVADALRAVAPGAQFSAVVGLFETAAILVFVAMGFDGLDGQG